MKAILIDELIKNEELALTTSEFSVEVNGQNLKGWQIAKPLNYGKKYVSSMDRLRMAKMIMDGKAIAVQFFEDLTPQQQQEYVKSKM